MTTTVLKGYTLWIHRSFDIDFIVYYTSLKDAWHSSINILKTIEAIEYKKPDVFTTWNIESGQGLSHTLFSSQHPPPAQLAEFWPPKSPHVDYPIANADSFQLFLVKGYGLSNIVNTKPEKMLLLTEAEAIRFMTDKEKDIEVVKTRNADILRPVY
jgi:hypothetical protein